jgi:DNA-binding MarR family transcriptional regulator
VRPWRREEAIRDGERVPRDSVDALLASWDEQRPELDFAPVGVLARLARVRRHVDAELERVFTAHGLTASTFGVLVNLGRVGGMGGVPERRLMDELGLTAETILARLDGLVRDGLVDRDEPAEEDGEAIIRLTAAGAELFARIIPAHLANEQRLLAALTDEERDGLAAVLRKLLVEFEGSRPPDGAPGRLGLTLAPVHLAADLREAVGLPPADGLLVSAVDRDGPAAAAGLRTGDVLLRAGEQDLRSVAALYGAFSEPGRVELDVLRGTDELSLTLEVPAGLDGSRASSSGRAAWAEHVL